MEISHDKIDDSLRKYEETILAKDLEINRLKDICEDNKMKLLCYEGKFTNINREYKKFKEDKKKLRENIEFLQSSLLKKEKEINLIEAMCIEKQKIIEQMQEEINVISKGTGVKHNLHQIE